VTWIALHTAYEHNHLFVDEQQKGPFAYWRHQHIFEPDGSGCILRDLIDYSLPFGLDPLLGLLAEKQLRRMFKYRHESTASALALT
jgi:ligand-binding SRPBCC domain-containing protein